MNPGQALRFPASSASTSEGAALPYAENDDGTPVVFTFPAGTRGINVSSRAEAVAGFAEDEWITTGQFYVTHAAQDDGVWYVDVSPTPPKAGSTQPALDMATYGYPAPEVPAPAKISEKVRASDLRVGDKLDARTRISKVFTSDGKTRVQTMVQGSTSPGIMVWGEDEQVTIRTRPVVPDSTPALASPVAAKEALAPTGVTEIETPSVKVAPAVRRIPMEFKEAAVSDVPAYVDDEGFYFQQKVDGIRAQLVLEPGKKPWFRSKSGDKLVNSSAAKVAEPLIKQFGAGLPEDAPAITIDGEILDGKWYVFDMTMGDDKRPWEQRMAEAEEWVTDWNDSGVDSIVALPTARTAEEKRNLFEAVRDAGGEGVMIKRADAKYRFGVRTDEILKAKITASADTVVMDVNVDGKTNAVLGVYRDGKLERVANVPTQGKGTFAPGDVVEVEYLWAHPDSRLLTQARIKKARPDKDPLMVTDSQFRYVNKGVLGESAMAPAAPTYDDEWSAVIGDTPPDTSVQTLSPGQAAALKTKVKGSGPRRTFMEEALDGHALFGDELTTVIAKIGPDGSPVAAASLVFHEAESLDLGDGESADMPAYLAVDYVATAEPGHGREIAAAIRAEAKRQGVPAYLEPTEDSIGFWTAVGAVQDPDDIGTDRYGWPQDTPEVHEVPAASPVDYDPMPYVMAPSEPGNVDLPGILGGMADSTASLVKSTRERMSTVPGLGERMDEIAEDLRAMTSGSTYVAIPHDRIGAILADGRLKSVFEKVASTGGAIDGKTAPGYLSARRSYENNIMGVGSGKAVKPAQRPIYGYIGPEAGKSGKWQGKPGTGVSGDYGSIHAELKPKTRSRTTATFGDSLNGAYKPVRLTGPDSVENVDTNGLLASGLARAAQTWGDALPDRDGVLVEYVEAQIHGGVSLDDIASFTVDIGHLEREIASREAHGKQLGAYMDYTESLRQQVVELREVADRLKKRGFDVRYI